jgi:hypothetical protein
MGNSCSCFEGPCGLVSVPLPPAASKPSLVSLPYSTPEEIIDVRPNNDLKPNLTLEESLCDTSAVSQAVSSPVSSISMANSVRTISQSNPIFQPQKLSWLRENQRIVSKLSRLSENVPMAEPSGDSEDSHW